MSRYVMDPADDEPGGPGVLESLSIRTSRYTLEMHRNEDGTWHADHEDLVDDAPKGSGD